MRVDHFLHAKFKLVVKSFGKHQQIEMVEDDPGSNNQLFCIKCFSRNYYISAFVSDHKTNGSTDNILRYFNCGLTNLTKIPDYILFVEDIVENHIDVIIVEMKSDTVKNHEVKAKFKNGTAIARFISEVIDKPIVQYYNLLSKKPMQATKPTTNRHNEKPKIIYNDDSQRLECRASRVDIEDIYNAIP